MALQVSEVSGRKEAPIEYHSGADALESPVHDLRRFLSAHLCKDFPDQPRKRSRRLGQEKHVATIVLDGVGDWPCRVALELSTTHDLHHTWFYGEWIRTESALLVLGDDDATVERVAVTAKEIGWDDRCMNIRTWNPGPPTERELADLLRALLTEHSLTEAATEADDTIVSWLRCLYANAYDRLDGLWLPYAATPIALIRDVAHAQCRIEVTAEPTLGRPTCEGIMHVESDFDHLPRDDEMWAHEWNFPLYYCTRELILPPEAIQSLGKPETCSAVVLEKRHVLRRFCEFMAVDHGDMAPKLRDEALRLHEPPPRRLLLRPGNSIVLTAEVGVLPTGATLVLEEATDDALTCRGATRDVHVVKRVPYTITLSASHGGAIVRTQTWTRVQFPVRAL